MSGIKNEYEWWCTIGRVYFPKVFVAARHYLWIPVVVTKCDSILSILAYMFNSRQASISPAVISNQIFIRANCEKLGYLSFEECSSSDSESSAQESDCIMTEDSLDDI